MTKDRAQIIGERKTALKILDTLVARFLVAHPKASLNTSIKSLVKWAYVDSLDIPAEKSSNGKDADVDISPEL